MSEPELQQHECAPVTVVVNGVAISDRAIEAEAAHHADSASPVEAAACALAIRELLLQRAAALGFCAGDAADSEDEREACIERLFAAEAPAPSPTERECLRFFKSHADLFVVGELVEGAHILFGVSASAPIEAIRRQAEATLKRVLAAPETFGDVAKRFSNCPSGALGGSLGQLQRGDSVPEFDRAIFGSEETGVLPRIVNSRYGFHIVLVARRVAGTPVDFQTARPTIARMLEREARTKAAEQYVRILAARAAVTGVDLGAARSPLIN